MEALKPTKLDGNQQHHNTFTPSLHLVPFFQPQKKKLHRPSTTHVLHSFCIQSRQTISAMFSIATTLQQPQHSLVPRPRGRRKNGLVSTVCACAIIPSTTWEFVYAWKLSVKSIRIRPIYFRIIERCSRLQV